MIVIQNLRYRYAGAGSDWVLRGINVHIAAGEYVVICGPSGSGKSTLCRVFNGLIPHFYGGKLEGKVQIAGLDTRTLPISELFALVGFVAQHVEAQLFNNTVVEEIAFGLESLGLSPSEIDRRIEEVAALLELESLLPRHPRQLSGGEQQLVAIAAMIALKPRVIVLDEPYANLDAINIQRLRNALRQLNRSGTTIILCEHRLQHVIAEANRMVIMHQGHIVRDGPPRAILREDLTTFGIEAPPVVQVARDLDFPFTPLQVQELIPAINGHQPPPSLLAAQTFAPPTPAGQPLIQLDRVTYTIGSTPILRQVSLDIQDGECLAIVGANGAGKTTLIKHINGLYRPHSGRVVVMNRDTRQTKVSQLAQHVGLAFQNPDNQFFTTRVWDEIVIGAHMLHRYDERWIRELVQLFNLEMLLDRSPYRLSGGEKKRIAFAASLAAQASILVLDEPTAGQDWRFRQALAQQLHQLRHRGRAIIIVTHDLEFAARHATRWIVIADGEIVTTGQPWEVMANTTAMQRAKLEPTQWFQIAAACNRSEALK